MINKTEESAREVIRNFLSLLQEKNFLVFWSEFDVDVIMERLDKFARTLPNDLTKEAIDSKTYAALSEIIPTVLGIYSPQFHLLLAKDFFGVSNLYAKLPVPDRINLGINSYLKGKK